MKNIQEILIKCGENGKLILGDEEIDVSITDIKSKLQKIGGYKDCYGKQCGGGNMIVTYLEVALCSSDFCAVRSKEDE